MTRCVVCEATGEPLGYRGLRRCSVCSHVWADLSIGGDEVRRLYQRSYFFGDEYRDYLDDRRIIEKNFAARLAVLRHFLTSSHRRLFEIGCAYGFFLNAVRGSFESVEGIDVSEDAIAFATRELALNVTCGDLLEADLSGRTFDVVCLWDTIEHLAEPRRCLETIASHMPRGSLAAITTGDIASLNARVQKARWRLIHPPTHLQYFTRDSLGQLLDRCGFRVVHVEHCGFYRSLGSMLHNLIAIGGRRPRAAGWMRRRALGHLDLYLNLYDIVYVIGERR
jgi:SAM-dependent methyltransferase